MQKPNPPSIYNIFRYFSCLPFFSAMTFILGLSLNSSYLLAAPHSITSPSCPSLPEIKHQPSTSQWIEIRQQLGAQLNYCLNDSAFFALYGASLLHSGLTAQSIEYLERALLLNPNNGSALIDYSEALYKSDQLLAAIQVNDQILSRHDLPEYLRVPLTERGKEWGNQRIEWQNKVSLASGYHDNLNGVANLKDLILTFDDRDIIVRLDENSRPIAGDYQTINASSQRSKLFDDGFSRFSVNVSSRTSELSRVDTDSVGLSYEKETLLVDGSFIWDLDSQYVFFGGKGLYLSSSSSASRYWRQERCSTYVTTEGRSLYFPDQPQSNEMALELQWGALCGPSNNQIDLSFSVAHNESLDHRPGGDRFIQELALQWKKSIGNGFLLSEISFSTTNDEKGYNPLLSNNEIRSVNTTNASVRFFYPLSKHLMLQSGLYYQGQDSNLSLFETQSKSADIGFTFSF